MDLSIIAWNARNLSETITRPGVRGRGLRLIFRINNIIANIRAWQPDIVFLLEAGSDSDEVAAYISSMSVGYSAIHSNVTQDESYIMLVKNSIASMVGRGQMVGTINNYRQGWFVPISSNRQTYNLVVLHAPSPSHSLNDRLAVIADVVQDAKRIDSANPILLMGDLNIKVAEQADLTRTLTAEGFTFLGPKQANGSPALTSLRKFTTIALTGGTGGAIDSQPYDQFWEFGGVTVGSIDMPAAAARPTASENLITWSSEGIEQVTQYIGGTGMTLRGQKTVDNQDVLYQNYTLFQTLYGNINSFGREVRELTRLPFSSWLSASSTIDAYANTLTLNTVNGQTSITLPASDYNKAKGIFSDATFYLGIINSIVSSKTNGGIHLLESIIFEHGLSDHLPIKAAVRVS
ncbi:MAG TPA: endonuclease/exonuclease/phosphatase family protein [Bacteroidia bacterium]|nr:endonuclease/exonuclease/phosphatase family protein [Bacteroidia bacterium]